MGSCAIPLNVATKTRVPIDTLNVLRLVVNLKGKNLKHSMHVTVMKRLYKLSTVEVVRACRVGSGVGIKRVMSRGWM